MLPGLLTSSCDHYDSFSTSVYCAPIESVFAASWRILCSLLLCPCVILHLHTKQRKRHPLHNCTLSRTFAYHVDRSNYPRLLFFSKQAIMAWILNDIQSILPFDTPPTPRPFPEIGASAPSSPLNLPDGQTILAFLRHLGPFFPFYLF